MKCIICFDNITDKFTTKCDHSFCSKCINSWVDENNSCPLCREENIITFCEICNVKEKGTTCDDCHIELTEQYFDEINNEKINRVINRFINKERERFNNLSKFQRFKLRLKWKLKELSFKKIFKNMYIGLFGLFTGETKIKSKKIRFTHYLLLSIFYGTLSAILPISSLILITVSIYFALRSLLSICENEQSRRPLRENIELNLENIDIQ